VGQFQVRFHFMENIDINVENTFVSGAPVSCRP
jgi:hypothetical protein